MQLGGDRGNDGIKEQLQGTLSKTSRTTQEAFRGPAGAAGLCRQEWEGSGRLSWPFDLTEHGVRSLGGSVSGEMAVS